MTLPMGFIFFVGLGVFKPLNLAGDQEHFTVAVALFGERVDHSGFKFLKAAFKFLEVFHKLIVFSFRNRSVPLV